MAEGGERVGNEGRGLEGRGGGEKEGNERREGRRGWRRGGCEKERERRGGEGRMEGWEEEREKDRRGGKEKRFAAIVQHVDFNTSKSTIVLVRNDYFRPPICVSRMHILFTICRQDV